MKPRLGCAVWLGSVDSDLESVMSVPPPPANADVRPASLAAVRAEALDTDRHRRVVPTGFTALDHTLAGGLRTQNLTIIGGRPGAGKTIAMLQWSRTMALAGETVVFACYEHDERTLMDRLLLLEVGELDELWSTTDRADARAGLADVSAGRRPLQDAVDSVPALAAADEQLRSFEEQLFLVRANGVTTTVGDLDGMVAEHGASVLMVDYLQKIPTDPWQPDDRLRVMRVAQELKDLAMQSDIVVVAAAIADRRGLDAPRLHLKHLDGSSTLTYESDAVLLLNDKYDIVHRSHIVYDPEGARDHHRYVVWSVEKHRDGAEGADIQFLKDFAHYRFQPDGALVHEKLLDERIDLPGASP